MFLLVILPVVLIRVEICSKSIFKAIVLVYPAKSITHNRVQSTKLVKVSFVCLSNPICGSNVRSSNPISSGNAHPGKTIGESNVRLK